MNESQFNALIASKPEYAVLLTAVKSTALVATSADNNLSLAVLQAVNSPLLQKDTVQYLEDILFVDLMRNLKNLDISGVDEMYLLTHALSMVCFITPHSRYPLLLKNNAGTYIAAQMARFLPLTRSTEKYIDIILQICGYKEPGTVEIQVSTIVANFEHAKTYYSSKSPDNWDRPVSIQILPPDHEDNIYVPSTKIHSCLSAVHICSIVNT